MCDGGPDECIGCVVTPIIIVVLPIVGLLRLGKYVFYDVPKSLLFKKKKRQQAQPQQAQAQAQTQPQQEQDDEPQPPSLRIKIPVSNQAEISFTPPVQPVKNPNRPVKNLRWSQDPC